MRGVVNFFWGGFLNFVLIGGLFLSGALAAQDSDFIPPFDLAPPPPKTITRQSGFLDGQAMVCDYSLEDSFYVLSPAYFLFEDGGFKIIDVDDYGRPKLVGGAVQIFDSSFHFFFPDNHKHGGDRVLNRRSLKMKHRDRDSLRKVEGACRIIKREAVHDAFGRKYFPE